MATLALAAAGTAIGGGGGTLGGILLGGGLSIVGSYLDQAYLIPLFGGRSQSPQHQIPDVMPSTTTDGAPANMCFGHAVRVPGHLIWVPKDPDTGKMYLEKSSESSDVGGGSGGGSTVSTTKYSTHVAIAWCATEHTGAMQAVRRVWGDSKGIFNESGRAFKCRAIRHYLGTPDQEPDPLIEEFEGIGNVSAYRGWCYTVIEGLELGHFGNRLPSFNALIEAQVRGDLADIIAVLCERAGLTSEQYDVSRVVGLVHGYNVPGQQDTARALQPLMATFDLGYRESGGRAIFYHRGQEEVISIPDDHVGCFEEFTTEGEPVEFHDVRDRELPTSLTVKYYSNGQKWLAAAKSYVMPGAPQSHDEEIDIPLVMPDTLAYRLARRLLYQARSERRSVTVTLPPDYQYLEEGDVLNLNHEGEGYTIWVERITRGVNGAIEIEGVVYDSATADTDSAGDDSEDPPTEGGSLTSPLKSVVLDIPAILDTHTDEAGFYWAACNEEPDEPYTGASLYISWDNVSWELWGQTSAEAVLGEANSVLPDATTVSTWDTSSSVQVTILNGTLQTRNINSVLGGNNWALLGNEVIGFRTAALTSVNADGSLTYQLSNLARGLRGTEWATDTHASGEVFVLFDNAVQWRHIGFGGLFVPRYAKIVPFGANPDNYPSIGFQPHGGTLEPFGPRNVQGSRDVDNNLTITWEPYSRIVARPFSWPQEPLLTLDRFEIDVYDNAETGVLRTIKTQADGNTAFYTADMQADDGFTPGDPIKVVVYQVSGYVGRGWPSALTSI